MPLSSKHKEIFSNITESIRPALQDMESEQSDLFEKKTGKILEFFELIEEMEQHPNPGSHYSREKLSETGNDTILNLSEIASLAGQRGLDREKGMLNEILLVVTHWIIRQRGEIHELEPVVNLLAFKANTTSESKLFTALYHVINDVIDHTAAEIREDVDKSDPERPWLMLNYNFAHVATRTGDKGLMIQAFDMLGRHLPESCSQFFSEGLRQSEEPVYGPEIKLLMSEYLRKWTTLH